MLNFSPISKESFLKNYWQQKPFVFRNAIENFQLPISADELAGLSMEEDIESRMVFETPNDALHWQLKCGPFTEDDYHQLPKSHWTLLVQGVDRILPSVAELREYFNFIPSWRFDDVMISVASEHGSVGPHYDNYDVFLYQAKGRRKWMLTTKNCNEENYLQGIELRIMKEFDIEEEIILEEGDMLYLPPHVGHHGVSLTDDCMTFSFGYRTYRSQELWDSFADHLSENLHNQQLYRDPDWNNCDGTGHIPESAMSAAKAMMQTILDDDVLFREWFGRFATSLDQSAEELLPLPLGVNSQDHADNNSKPSRNDIKSNGNADADANNLDEIDDDNQVSDDDEYNEIIDIPTFLAELKQSQGVKRDPVCRFSYVDSRKVSVVNSNTVSSSDTNVDDHVLFFANSCLMDTKNVSVELLKIIANQTTIENAQLQLFIEDNGHKKQQSNIAFLFELYELQWLLPY